MHGRLRADGGTLGVAKSVQGAVGRLNNGSHELGVFGSGHVSRSKYRFPEKAIPT
jgi:hypothetical protein